MLSVSKLKRSELKRLERSAPNRGVLYRKRTKYDAQQAKAAKAAVAAAATASKS